ncbi:hypothetical protein ASU28_00635 [Lactiplantibacillus paraplantarum]|nr:hypothetical protein ASU28_00635 [Lactiplantibacillus paraplantarum]
MENGGWYDIADPDINDLMQTASKLNYQLNYGDATRDALEIKQQLFGKADKSNMIFLPIKVATGQHTYLGRGAMINYDCDLMDQGRIEIGERTLIGPHCQLITIYHPLHAGSRSLGKVKTRPIKIGADCWIGAGVTIMGGVELGNKTIVGAGAVVTKSFPDGSVIIGGNPAQYIRNTDDQHSDIPEDAFKASEIRYDVKQRLNIGERVQVAAMTLPPNTRGGHWGFQGTNDAVISVSRDGSVTATGVGTAQVRLTFVQPNFEQVLTEAIDFTVSASRPTTSVAHPSWRLVD